MMKLVKHHLDVWNLIEDKSYFARFSAVPPAKCNIDREKSPSQKESSLPSTIFQGHLVNFLWDIILIYLNISGRVQSEQ